MGHADLRLLLVVAGFCLAQPAAASAQDTGHRPHEDTAGAPAATFIVVPAPGYEIGSFSERILGDNWRELWTTPVEVPVFDFDRVAGGVDWVKRGGGHQSITLHLVERNGWREYRFRSVDKFPVVQAMPPAVRGTPAGAIVQDQVSTLFPAAPLIVPPLMEAAGLLHVRPALYVMPDDPRLEVYQDTFAGMLGTFEVKPDEGPDDEPGLGGSRKIKSTSNFFDDLRDSRAHRLDEHELLAARLIDFLINDTDRTPDNFRWARFGEEEPYLWRPVPIDRDRAFMDAGGLVNKLVRMVYPKLVEFGPDFSLVGLTHTSHPLDRRLLQRLTRSDFRETAERVRRAIDDDVIAAVIAALPPRWQATESAARLRRGLEARRDRLPEVALDFYDDLAGEVDIHGTDEDERASIFRHSDGRVTVTVTGRDEPERVELVRHDDGDVTLTLLTPADSPAGGAPFYQRTFRPTETSEVRVFLGDGDDLAIVRGAPSSSIGVRIIGGPGDDMLVDSAGGGATYFYDSEGDNRFVTAAGTRVDARSWEAAEQTGGLRLGQDWSPDWGDRTRWSAVVDYAEGSGPVLGFGPVRRAYGFRRLPHRLLAEARVHVGLGSGRLGATADVDYRAENSPRAITLAATATQIDRFRFYGFGNETSVTSHEITLVDRDIVSIEPALVWHIGWRSREGLSDPLRDHDAPEGLRPVVGRLVAGPVFHWSNVTPRDSAPAADVLAERSGGARAGVHLGLELDRTDQDQVPTRGWVLGSRVEGYPPLLATAGSFGTAAATAAAYLPLPASGVYIALRGGGALTTGPVPVEHAATLGGSGSLRGFRSQRYTGDTSVYGSTELRVPVGTVSLFVRWDVGVFALADAGRVWFDGASPGGWHTGVGAGLWLSALGQAFSFAYARGEDSRVYLGRGLSF